MLINYANAVVLFAIYVSEGLSPTKSVGQQC